MRNQELEAALLRAESDRRAAQDAKAAAERNEKQARAVEERAKILLAREQDRVNKLTSQLGSPLVEVLK